MRRVRNDALISLTTLAVLMTTLVVIDERVRDYFAATMNSVSSDGLGRAGARLASMGPLLYDAARDQGLAHGPMVIFVAVAGVLFICMFRT